MTFTELLKRNRNYRFTWLGQVVSEIGDHFNNIAVFSLAYRFTGSGMAVTWVMLARAIPAVLAGPVAGVLLDRLDRKRVMIASDLVRAGIALLFITAHNRQSEWMLYVLSGLLMFASPFFTSGRAAILPNITTREELHAANALTQTTQWVTTAVGAFLGGMSAELFGFDWAFFINFLSFLFSAWCIWQLKTPRGHFRAQRVAALTEAEVARPWHEYLEGLEYMRRNPLVLAIALVGVGWATGGGAAQILFTLFGEQVFGMGAVGTGTIWGCAGLGLVCGGILAHRLRRRLSFAGYKRAIAISYVLHGSTYVLFSQMTSFGWALVFIAASRAAVAVSSVLNTSTLLEHVPDEYRGRVFATIESMTWSTMMFSMLGAGIASRHVSPRTIAAAAGLLSSTTAIFWTWANLSGRLPEPARVGTRPDEVEVHGEAAR
jgi:MFS family permease